MSSAIDDFKNELLLQMQVDFYLYGDTNTARASYNEWLKKLKKDLREEESWLQTNPRNEITQSNVAWLRREVAEQQRRCDKAGKNETVIWEIKYATKVSQGGQASPIKNGVLKMAWNYCEDINQFENIFNKGGSRVISTQFSSKDGPFLWDRDKDSIKLIVCDVDDTDFKDIYEVSYTGECRKLNDEESETIRINERRKKERLAADAAMNEKKQMEAVPKKDCWFDKNGYLLGWFILIVFLIWVASEVISRMP